MSDDSVEQKEIPSEVGQIVEEAIDKIYNILLPNDPDARQRVAALIRSYIEGKYFSTPQSFLLEAKAFGLKLLKGEMDSEALRTIADDYVNFAKAQAVNIVDSIKKGEVDPEVVTERLASIRNVLADSGFFPPTTPKARKLRTRDNFLLLYDEYCGKRGLSKAEFVRQIIKGNKMEVPKGERRGINGTNFNNVYRCLNEFLKERRSKAD
jgi:hypothetical protein